MGKLLAILSLGQSLYSKWLLRRLIISAVTLAALIIVTAMMVGVMLTIGFYAAYQALLHAGISTDLALLWIAGIVVLVIVLLVLFSMICIRNLGVLPQRVYGRKTASLGGHAGEVIDAFLGGLLGEPRK